MWPIDLSLTFFLSSFLLPQTFEKSVFIPHFFFTPLPSGFHFLYSTETALPKVARDLSVALPGITFSVPLLELVETFDFVAYDF